MVRGSDNRARRAVSSVAPNTTDVVAISSFHQAAPYIGKLKSTIATQLVLAHSAAGDLIADPFCGSGTIPLEAVLNGRMVIASDCSDYALTLTRAKLRAPKTAANALSRLDQALDRSSAIRIDLRTVPKWVRNFFHPETLRETMALAAVLQEGKEYFLLACLLGILHHQRPGFLSYPASHLVPYLRTTLFPPDQFAHMYEYRELRPRMAAKIERMFKKQEQRPHKTAFQVRPAKARHVNIWRNVDAIITSPPYMNALDYVRDNRLRLWLLSGQHAFTHAAESVRSRSGFADLMRKLVRVGGKRLKPGGRCVVVVGEATSRSDVVAHPAEILLHESAQSHMFRLVDCYQDEIPDIRRARREGRATKRELIVVLERK